MPAAEQILARALGEPCPAELEHLVRPEVELEADARAAAGGQGAGEAAGEDEAVGAERRRLSPRRAGEEQDGEQGGGDRA